MSDFETRDALFIPSDQRSNFKDVVAKRSDLLQVDGGRIKPAPTTTPVLTPAGTVLGFATTGGDAGFYKPYASGNSDGSQVAVGVLKDSVLTDNLGNGSEIAIIKEGILFQDLLIGLDGGAITALGGKASVEHGTNLIRIRA